MYGVLGCGAYTREQEVGGKTGLRNLREHALGSEESGVSITSIH